MLLIVLLLYIVAFLFGILLGNFATTVYYRLPRGITVFGFDVKSNKPPRCSSCNTELKYYEYLPLLSWISTRGKCNYCGKHIDRSYILLEISVGIISVLLYYFLGFSDLYVLLSAVLTIALLISLLYFCYQRIWANLTILLVFLCILTRVLVDGELYPLLWNLFLAVLTTVNILKFNKSEEVVIITFTLGSLSNLYIFLVYVIICYVFFYYIQVAQMKKRKYLYYGGMLALFLVIFFNYLMPKDFSIFSNNLPIGFVYLSEVAPDIVQDVKYATDDNFTGKVVPGYQKATIILTKEAANALAKVQATLKEHGFSLKVFDGYRPVTAVKSFNEWALSGKDDQKIKERFYPNVDKSDLLNGYISAKSTHSRGSTVDLTIVDLATGKELDMGTEFDFLDQRANTDFPGLPEEVKRNRDVLRIAMETHGFEGYKFEWWHFKLKNEPFTRYPEDHFDFSVK